MASKRAKDGDGVVVADLRKLIPESADVEDEGDTPSTSEEPYARPFDDSDEEPIEYVCEDLRLAPSDGKVSIIAGEPGSGKGPLATYFAVCAALGAKAFGRFPFRKSRVLLLDAEGLRLSKRRMRRFVRGLGRDPGELAETLFTRDVSSDNLVEEFEKLAEDVIRNEIDVVVLDSYTSAMLATDLDPNKVEWGVLAKMLGALEVLVIVVAHSRKLAADSRPTLADVAGSFALASLAATALCVWHPKPESTNLIRVACARAPETAFQSVDLEFVDSANDGLVIQVKTAAESEQEKALAEQAKGSADANRVIEKLRWNAQPLAINKVEELTGIHYRRLKALMPALVDAGVLSRESHGSTFLYVLANHEQGPVVLDEAGKVAPAPASSPGSVGKFSRRERDKKEPVRPKPRPRRPRHPTS